MSERSRPRTGSSSSLFKCASKSKRNTLIRFSNSTMTNWMRTGSIDSSRRLTLRIIQNPSMQVFKVLSSLNLFRKEAPSNLRSRDWAQLVARFNFNRRPQRSVFQIRCRTWWASWTQTTAWASWTPIRALASYSPFKVWANPQTAWVTPTKQEPKVPLLTRV